MKLSTPAAIVVLLASSGSSAGSFVDDPIEWNTDIRRCSASYTGNGSGSTWQDRPTPYAPYQGAADLVASNGVETWSPHCTQESELDGSSASYVGWAESAIIAGLLSNPQTAQAQSKYDMWFTLAGPVEYELTGEVSEGGHSDSLAFVRLTNLEGDVIELVSSTADSSTAFHRSGTLPAGMYRLYVEVLGKCRTLPPLLVSQGEAACTMGFAVVSAPAAPVGRPTKASSTSAPGRR